MTKRSKKLFALLSATALTVSLTSNAFAANTMVTTAPSGSNTPIKHLVVIFQENVSFDHYFATYPTATNPKKEPAFFALAHTPKTNNLANGGLLTNNPNDSAANGAGAANPFRLDRTQAATADQNHGYTAEQQAYDNGAADLFPKYTGDGTAGGVGAFGTAGQVMGYYDGNTVTALWNYAQRFAMNDNAYTDTYGPSTPGALEAISGQTNGMAIVKTNKTSYYIPDGQGGYTLMGDVDPAGDVCASTTNTSVMTGKNVGDLMNDQGVTWGAFMGGFNLKKINKNSSTGCARATTSTVTQVDETDYIPHHAWFQYYASTSNPTHARPSSVEAIGYSNEASGKPDPANHEYDIDDFYNAVSSGNFPQVSYLKAPAYQDGHAGYSDPLDEQAFIVKVVNFLQQQDAWKDTAVIVTYDDSDGWYDHAYAKPTSPSFNASVDALNGAGVCGSGTPANGLGGAPVNGRCGPGTRIPFLLLSPYAKPNYVSHKRISQASIARFIEENWLNNKRIGGGSFDATAGSIMDMFDFTDPPNDARLYLNPNTGEISN